jgi:hypothetical protein
MLSRHLVFASLTHFSGPLAGLGGGESPWVLLAHSPIERER